MSSSMTAPPCHWTCQVLTARYRSHLQASLWMHRDVDCQLSCNHFERLKSHLPQCPTWSRFLPDIESPLPPWQRPSLATDDVDVFIDDCSTLPLNLPSACSTLSFAATVDVHGSPFVVTSPRNATSGSGCSEIASSDFVDLHTIPKWSTLRQLKHVACRAGHIVFSCAGDLPQSCIFGWSIEVSPPSLCSLDGTSAAFFP